MCLVQTDVQTLENQPTKGGGAMRVKGRWILLALLAVGLALLASASLVERPAELREAAELPPAPPAAAWTAESFALPETSAAAPRTQIRGDACAILPAPGSFTPEGCVEECDTNGCPLHGVGFVQARYQAFPREDMPG